MKTEITVVVALLVGAVVGFLVGIIPELVLYRRAKLDRRKANGSNVPELKALLSRPDRRNLLGLAGLTEQELSRLVVTENGIREGRGV